MLRIRRGIPRFARKLHAGEPVTIVAFGTSMTLHSRCGRRLGGLYLDHLVETLREASGNERIELVYNGLEGFTSWWAAHRVRSDVLPRRPDLVILELAHNDEGKFVPAIPLALDGIVAQIREALPECELVSVILAPAGEARNGPNASMQAHEAVAQRYGFPSFDLATLAEQLVAEGRATWRGDSSSALTFDGIHHSELAAELLGIPFARRFGELIGASLALPLVPPVPARPSPAARARRLALRPFLVEGPWTVGPSSDEIYCNRNVAAFVDEVAVANAPGATMRLRFAGMHAQVWALGVGGALRIVADGVESAGRLSDSERTWWTLVNLAADFPDARHDVELTVLEAPLVLGDLFIVGEVAT